METAEAPGIGWLGEKVGLRVICEHTLYCGALGPDSVVVDLGACRGRFSRAMVREFGCRVYAVEASSDLFAEMKVREPMRKFNFAVADRDGEAVFYPGDKPVSGNILGEKPNSGEGVPVECRKFETFLRQEAIERIDLLKVDIEGAEVLLFDSMSDESLRRICQMSVEFHDSVRHPNVTAEEVRRIIARLRSLGFQGARTRDDNYDWLFINTAALRLPLATQAYLRAHASG